MPDREALTRTVLTDEELEKVIEHVSSKVLANTTKILISTLVQELEVALVPRVEKRIRENFTMAVGRSVINKTFLLVGALAIFAFFILARTGIIKMGPVEFGQ
jgi:RecG-like helicase